MIAEQPPEMPNRDAESCAEGRFGPGVEHAGDDQLHGAADQLWGVLPQRAQGTIGPAAKTSAKTGRFRRGRQLERLNVLS